MAEDRVAFIGAGNMAGALIRGLVGGGVGRASIWASDPREARLAELEGAHGIRTGTDNEAAARWADVVVLAIKPQLFGAVLPTLAGAVGPGQLVLSVAAGVTIDAIERFFGEGTRVVRAMPNTPALVLTGVTGFALGQHATADDSVRARRIFSSVGTAIEVAEPQLDVVTGLSGSGPAYVFRMIEGLVAGAEAEGLDRDTALALAAGTVLGAARLLLEEGEAPESLRARVTSPKGTTEAGLAHLDEAHFFEAVEGAVRAATARSRELGRETEAAERETRDS